MADQHGQGPPMLPPSLPPYPYPGPTAPPTRGPEMVVATVFVVGVVALVLAPCVVVLLQLSGVGSRSRTHSEPTLSDPVTVAVGDGFTVDDVEVLPGWRVRTGRGVGASSVVGLRSTGGSDVLGATLVIRVEVASGNHSIECRPAALPIADGPGVPFDCVPTSEPIGPVDAVEVTTRRSLG